MDKLPQSFIERMEKQLGPQAPAFFACYEAPARRGLRVNTLRLSPAAFLQLSPVAVEPGNLLEEGFLLPEQAPSLGNHPFHQAGVFYLQEPSAMAPIGALEVRPGMRILDLCAAPGGKSGGIAARLQGSGLLVANEVVPSRAKTLCHTLERLGVTNAAVTCAQPADLCNALPGWFDAVLVDAPCSGEGMFRKDPAAIQEWSPAHVLACARRQEGILHSAAGTVGAEGLLVYATCTFSPEENEGVVEAFLKSHPGFSLISMERIFPHTYPGEGHFIAKMRREEKPDIPASQKRAGSLSFPACKEAAFTDFCRRTLTTVPAGEAVHLRDGRVLLLSGPLPAGLGKVRLLRAGIYAGDMLPGRFQPNHALAMAAGVEWGLTFSPEAENLQAYLRGQAVAAPGIKGWCRVEVDGFPLGLGKGVDGQLKNHLPKGLRLL